MKARKASGAARIEALKPFTEYGPNYRRGIREHIREAQRQAEFGALNIAEIHIREAECLAGLRHYSTVNTGTHQGTLV